MLSKETRSFNPPVMPLRALCVTGLSDLSENSFSEKIEKVYLEKSPRKLLKEVIFGRIVSQASSEEFSLLDIR